MEIFFKLTPCPVCKKNASSSLGACKSCQANLFMPRIEPELIYLGDYDNGLERAIKALKFRNAHRLSLLFAKTLAVEIKRANWQIDIICPIPLHWSRYLERGYNQSALVAKALAKELDVEFIKLLKRKKRTKQQAKLNRLERKHNLNKAFELNSYNINNKNIVILDDVVTSGATVSAAISVLNNANIKSVKVVAIARTSIMHL